MIKVCDLTVKFDDFTIFENLNFEIEKEKITIIVGLNGTGKTTLIKSLCKSIPYCGQINRGYKKCFYLPQNVSYPQSLTLFEYLSSIFFSKGFKWRLSKEEKNQIEKVIKEVELEDKTNLKLSKLSSGEFQKANIALALLSEAEILFLDEPTSNMDLINQIKILDILKNLKKEGLTSVLILHDLNLASNYGDNFIGISQNGKLTCERKNDFFKKEILGQIFNLEFEVIEGEKNIFIQTFN